MIYIYFDYTKINLYKITQNFSRCYLMFQIIIIDHKYNADVYKRQLPNCVLSLANYVIAAALTQSECPSEGWQSRENSRNMRLVCLLYTSRCV